MAVSAGESAARTGFLRCITAAMAAMSRIGAAGGTFLLPVGIAHLGIGASLLIAAGVCAVGLVVTYLWAPETTNLSLTQSESATPP